MTILLDEKLVDAKISAKYRTIIRNDTVRDAVFDVLTINARVLSDDCYDKIAKVVAETNHPRNLTVPEIIRLTGPIYDEPVKVV